MNSTPSATFGRRGQVEELGSVAVHDFGQRDPQTALQVVGDRAQATVENDVAGFRQRFLLELHQFFEWQFATDDRAHQLHALRFGKDEQRAALDVTLEVLVDGDQASTISLTQVRDRFFARHDRDFRDGENDFLAHHLAQAERCIAHPEIDQLGERVHFQLGQHRSSLRVI